MTRWNDLKTVFAQTTRHCTTCISSFQPQRPGLVQTDFSDVSINEKLYDVSIIEKRLYPRGAAAGPGPCMRHPPPPPGGGVLRDSGVGAMAPIAPKFFCACFPFIKPSMF